MQRTQLQDTHTLEYGKESFSSMLLEGESTAGFDSVSIAGTPELVLWQRRTGHMKKKQARSGQKTSSTV